MAAKNVKQRRLLGTHESIVGGYHRALERAGEAQADCVQLFVTPPRRWPTAPVSTATSDRPMTQRVAEDGGVTCEEADRFRETLQRTGVRYPLCHASYLINLATPDPALWQRSVESLLFELRRCERLGIPALVLHPGAATSSSESAGMAQIVRGLNEVAADLRGAKIRCLLETTAGQGSCLGHRFEQLAELLTRVQDPGRFAICLDTCHLFAAGYPLGTLAEYRKTMKQLDQTCGADQVLAIHVNDSLKPLGSRKDRHAHIGEGLMGLDAFRHLLNDDRFAAVPMYLETAKEMCGDEPWDQVNLRTLRGLLK